ncbi:MAG: hypothetical protein ABGX51_03650 [Gammaproteobacteria bacterium]
MGQKRSYKTYPKEFKEEAVNLVNEQALAAPDGVIVSRRRREICQSEVCE